jgi:hypothetical protein
MERESVPLRCEIDSSWRTVFNPGSIPSQDPVDMLQPIKVRQPPAAFPFSHRQQPTKPPGRSRSLTLCTSADTALHAQFPRTVHPHGIAALGIPEGRSVPLPATDCPPQGLATAAMAMVLHERAQYDEKCRNYSSNAFDREKSSIRACRTGKICTASKAEEQTMTKPLTSPSQAFPQTTPAPSPLQQHGTYAI